jgi:stage II sporulation protein AA (anti-sigma F factor antagonist)
MFAATPQDTVGLVGHMTDTQADGASRLGGSGDPARAARIELRTFMRPDGTMVIVVAGEVDLSNAGRLTETLDNAASSNPRALVLDLGGVTFIDSSGLHALLGASGRVPSVRIRRPSRQVRRLLEVAGLDQVLPNEQRGSDSDALMDN